MTKLLVQRPRFPIHALAVIAISIAGLLFYWQFRAAAFPENGIRMDVTRDQAAVRSADFLLDVIGQDVGGYNATTVWMVDDNAKTYLEKELGVERTTELADRVDLWGYWTRYVRPLQKEEFQVVVAPDGRVVGYAHLVDEAAPGAHLDRDEALRLAEAARRDVVPVDGAWRLVDGTATEQPARRDWHFTWERTDLPLPATGPDGRDAGAARLTVVVQGDRVDQVTRGLKVPEGWEREYEQIRSANDLAFQLALVLGLLPLILAALSVFVRRWMGRDLRWRTALTVGVVGGMLSAAAGLNALPVAISGYDTTMAWEAFLGLAATGALFSGVHYLVLIPLFGAAGEALYREQFPGHLSLRASFSWRGAMTRSGALALGLGSLLAPVMFAYQIAYYLAGSSIGFWGPADSGSQNVYSFFAPWFAPASLSYNAAIAEEFAYRLFAITALTLLFGRVLRRAGAARWLAIVVSAFAWGFLHANYPQDPFFVRGLEIGLAGIVYGWLMVRFGILAPIAIHYTFDALWTASALDHAASLPVILLAYGFVVIPLLVALVAVVRAGLRGGFVPEGALLNSAERDTVPVDVIEPSAPAVDGRYAGLTRGRRRMIVAASAVGMVALVVATVTMPFRQTYAVGRDEAAARADAALAGAGVDFSGYRRVVTLYEEEDGQALTYLREHAESDAEAALYRSVFPATRWRVRYTRPLERDEYRVYFATDAAPGTPPSRIVYDLGDDTPGARLPADEARQQAEAHLHGLPAWQGANLTLVDMKTEEHANRTDYHFVFEREDGRVADATIRAAIDVVGDRVSGYDAIVKVPEEWARAQSGVTLKMVAGGLAGGAVVIALLVLGGLAFLRLARARALPLRSSILVAVAVGVLGLIGEVNSWALLYDGYDTTQPVLTFLTMQVAGKAALLIGLSLFAAVAWSLLIGLWCSEVGPSLPTDDRRAWAKDGALLGLALSLMHLGSDQILARISARMPFDAAASAPFGAATAVPALAALANAPGDALMAMVLVSVYLLLRRTLRGGQWVFLASLSLPLVSALSEQTLVDGLLVGARYSGLVLLIAISVRWLARTNLPAYLGAAVVSGLLFNAVTLLRSGDGSLVGNGLAVVLITVAGLIGFVMVAWRSQSGSAGPAALPAGGEAVGCQEGRLAA